MIKINGNSDFERRLRRIFMEDTGGILIIPLERKADDIKNVYSVDGYYKIWENTPLRMAVEFRAESPEDANRQAKENGLVQGIMVEAYLSPMQTCTLGLSSEEIRKAIESDERILLK